MIEFKAEEKLGIGEIIRKEREKKGISIDYLSNLTKISKEFIRAIEEEKFDLLPGDVYVKGFIRNISLVLGLNPDELKKIYTAQRAALYEEKILKEAKEKLPAYDAKVEKKVKPKRPWILILFLLVMIIGGSFYLYASRTGMIDLFSRTFVKTPTPSFSGQEVTKSALKGSSKDEMISYESSSSQVVALGTETVAVAALESSVSSVTQLVSSPKVEKLNLKVVATGRCWLRVSIDGKKVFEGVLVKGDEKVWEAEENITVRFGNINEVKVYFNGEEVRFPSSKTGVVDIVFPQ